MSHNKYLDEEDSSDSDWDDDIDIHEVVRSGTFQEVKEAIAMDRPRYVALKDEVRVPSTRSSFQIVTFLQHSHFFCAGWTMRHSLRR